MLSNPSSLKSYILTRRTNDFLLNNANEVKKLTVRETTNYRMELEVESSRNIFLFVFVWVSFVRKVFISNIYIFFFYLFQTNWH